MDRKKNRFKVDNEIAKKLHPYWLDGTGVMLTAGQTGINKNTVSKYFRYWTEEEEDKRSVLLGQRQRRANARYSVVYDRIAHDTRALLSKIKHELQQKENFWTNQHKQQIESHDPTLEPYSYNLRLVEMIASINNLLGNQILQKARMESAPFIDEVTEEATLKRLEDKLNAVRKES